MYPASFPEETSVLDRPPQMTADQCDPLPVARIQYPDGTPCVISCWKPTKAELSEIQKTGRVWLSIVGVTMPPAYVGGFTPFEDEPE